MYLKEKMNEFPLLVHVIHEEFGCRQITVSDFLDEKDVIAMDNLRAINKKGKVC